MYRGYGKKSQQNWATFSEGEAPAKWNAGFVSTGKTKLAEDKKPLFFLTFWR